MGGTSGSAGIATIGFNAELSYDGADKELESLENKAFYFHTHIPTDKKTHVVTAKMTGVKKNCLAHSGTKGTNVPTNGSGVSWPALIVILVILIALGAAGGFVWYQRLRNDMRHRVQSILEQYQPLEEISGKDESETAAML